MPIQSFLSKYSLQHRVFLMHQREGYRWVVLTVLLCVSPSTEKLSIFNILSQNMAGWNDKHFTPPLHLAIACAFSAEYNLLKSISQPLFKKSSQGPKNLTTHCNFSNFFLFWGGMLALWNWWQMNPVSLNLKWSDLEVLRTEKHCQFLWAGSKGRMKKAIRFCSYWLMG